MSRNSCTRWVPGTCSHTHKCSLLICQYLPGCLKGNSSFVTSHPGTWRVHDFLLTQGVSLQLWLAVKFMMYIYLLHWQLRDSAQSSMSKKKWNQWLRGEGGRDPSSYFNQCLIDIDFFLFNALSKPLFRPSKSINFSTHFDLVMGYHYHTIIWICPSVCPSVCPFRIYSVDYGRIGTKLGRYIRETLEKNLRVLVSMATILVRGLGHKTDISPTPINQMTIPSCVASFY